MNKVTEIFDSFEEHVSSRLDEAVRAAVQRRFFSPSFAASLARFFPRRFLDQCSVLLADISEPIFVARIYSDALATAPGHPSKVPPNINSIDALKEFVSSCAKRYIELTLQSHGHSHHSSFLAAEHVMNRPTTPNGTQSPPVYDSVCPQYAAVRTFELLRSLSVVPSGCSHPSDIPFIISCVQFLRAAYGGALAAPDTPVAAHSTAIASLLGDVFASVAPFIPSIAVGVYPSLALAEDALSNAFATCTTSHVAADRLRTCTQAFGTAALRVASVLQYALSQVVAETNRADDTMPPSNSLALGRPSSVAPDGVSHGVSMPRGVDTAGDGSDTQGLADRVVRDVAGDISAAAASVARVIGWCADVDSVLEVFDAVCKARDGLLEETMCLLASPPEAPQEVRTVGGRVIKQAAAAFVASAVVATAAADEGTVLDNNEAAQLIRAVEQFGTKLVTAAAALDAKYSSVVDMKVTEGIAAASPLPEGAADGVIGVIISLVTAPRAFLVLFTDCLAGELAAALGLSGFTTAADGHIGGEGVPVITGLMSWSVTSLTAMPTGGKGNRQPLGGGGAAFGAPHPHDDMASGAGHGARHDSAPDSMADYDVLMAAYAALPVAYRYRVSTNVLLDVLQNAASRAWREVKRRLLASCQTAVLDLLLFSVCSRLLLEVGEAQLIPIAEAVSRDLHALPFGHLVPQAAHMVCGIIPACVDIVVAATGGLEQLLATTANVSLASADEMHSVLRAHAVSLLAREAEATAVAEAAIAMDPLADARAVSDSLLRSVGLPDATRAQTDIITAAAVSRQGVLAAVSRTSLSRAHRLLGRFRQFEYGTITERSLASSLLTAFKEVCGSGPAATHDVLRAYIADAARTIAKSDAPLGEHSPPAALVPYSDCTSVQAVADAQRPFSLAARLVREASRALHGGPAVMAGAAPRSGHARHIFSNDDVYDGDWRQGVPHGRGVYLFAQSGNVYDGEFEHGTRSGHGRFEYAASGEVYDGEWLGGLRTGTGQLTTKEGDVYKGEWVGGQLSGWVEVACADGEAYAGEFKEGRLCGRGSRVRPNGDSYEGEWVDGVEDGEGTYTYADGSTYKGQFAAGARSGPGEYHAPDGSQYVGEWRDGTMHGAGTYTFNQPPGGSYAGEWSRDAMHGRGLFRYSNGTHYFVEYENGACVRRMRVNASPSPPTTSGGGPFGALKAVPFQPPLGDSLSSPMRGTLSTPTGQIKAPAGDRFTLPSLPNSRLASPAAGVQPRDRVFVSVGLGLREDGGRGV